MSVTSSVARVKAPDTDIEQWLISSVVQYCQSDASVHVCHLTATSPAFAPELQGIQQAPDFKSMVPKRRTEFLAGRFCALQCLEALCLPREVVERGRDRAPQWPPGTIGAITHSPSTAACIIGRTSRFSGMGVDIEHVVDAAVARDVSRLVLSGFERRYLNSISYDCHDYARRFTATFSAKESLYKAIYPQVRRFLEFRCVRLIEFGSKTLLFELVETLSPSLKKGRLLSVFYTAAAEQTCTWLPLE